MALPVLTKFLPVPAIKAPIPVGAPTPVAVITADPIARANSSAAIEPIIPNV